MRVLVICNNGPGTQTAQILEALVVKLRERHSACMHLRAAPKGTVRKLGTVFAPPLGLIRAALRADHLIVHSFLGFNLLPILLMRLRGRRVTAILWDIYPDSVIALGLMRRGAVARVLGWVERRLIALAERKAVPTADYLSVPALAGRPGLRVLPIWPYAPGIRTAAPRAEGALRIAFAGSIDPIRDLPGAARALAAAAGEPVDLHVFSRQPFAAPGVAGLTVRQEGFLSPEALQARLAEMDAGLVCLDPRFTFPAMPSKILAYVTAGLPVVFRGPPAPALRRFLAETGVGISVAEDGAGDLGARIRALRANFAPRQRAFLDATRLEWDRLAEIL